MNMDEYFVLFREYMLVQKPSSVNTRDSYLRDVSAFLRYLEGENITSPLEVETETVEAYVQHLHSLNRTNSTISRNIASVRCFYKFLILRGDMQVNPAKSVKLEKEPKKRCWSFFMPPVFASVSSSTSTCRISTCARESCSAAAPRACAPFRFMRKRSLLYPIIFTVCAI